MPPDRLGGCYGSETAPDPSGTARSTKALVEQASHGRLAWVNRGNRIPLRSCYDRPMAHWEHRPEARWKEFRFNQPYAKGLARLKDEVLAKTDFDPATLW